VTRPTSSSSNQALGLVFYIHDAASMRHNYGNHGACGITDAQYAFP
jgi:hypothetical protein